MDEFKNRVESLLNAGREKRAAGLIELAPLFMEMEGLRSELSDAAQQASDDAAAQLQAIQDAASETAAAQLEASTAATEAAAEAAAAWLSAVANIRGDYSLDSSGFASSFDAKLASEVRRNDEDRIAQDVINAQNEELRRQSLLLESIQRELTKQTRNGNDSLLQSQLT